MPVYCDDFACTHVNGTIQDVKNYVTPFDPAVQDLAMELGFDIKNMFNWAQDEVEYVYPTKDYWQKPKETIKSLRGDCLDKAAALTSMIIAAGYPSWVTLVYLPKRKEYHAYTTAMIDGGIKKLDPTCLYCSVYKFPDESMLMLVDFDHTGLIQLYESD